MKTKENQNSDEPKLVGLELLRKPFEKHQISKLPKPTASQTEDVKKDYKQGFRCPDCDGWHHPKVVHLDYVGHAALTDRLLDTDPNWNWEPVSFNAEGTPRTDSNGGLWIKLTVCGITRLGYGHADGKTGGNAIKETIGDALRNAAMRFGAALDLWHKGDLHLIDDPEPIADTKNKIDTKAAIAGAKTEAKNQVIKIQSKCSIYGHEIEKMTKESLEAFLLNAKKPEAEKMDKVKLKNDVHYVEIQLKKLAEPKLNEAEEILF